MTGARLTPGVVRPGAGVVADAVIVRSLVAGDSAVVLLLVSEHGVLQSEASVADVAAVGSLSSVSPHVSPQVLC